eukprot:gene55368-59744_t
MQYPTVPVDAAVCPIGQGIRGVHGGGMINRKLMVGGPKKRGPTNE